MRDRSPTVRVSKMLSLMLRHRPQEFGVEADTQGFVDFDEAVLALQERDERITAEDVEKVVHAPEKKRFEIADGRIRARYGHSFEIDLGVDPFDPPEFLYKGIPSKDTGRVMDEGLTSGDRHYVHLSYDAEVAGQLGRDTGTVIRVSAREAHGDGLHFFDCGPTVLIRNVPASYLKVAGESESPPPTGGIDGSRETDSSDDPQFGRRRRFVKR